MQNTSPGTAYRAAKSSWLLAGALLLRLVAVLMTTELSGAAHLALDGVELLSGAEHHQEQHDCDDEESGHECPPGCLNCHCAHAAALAFSVRYDAHYQAVLIEPDLPNTPARVDVHPQQTARDSIYRPPRARA